MLLVTLAIVLAACGSPTPTAFPELEPHGGLPSDFAWQFKDGPDFYVYEASSPSHPNCSVGLYFGTAPQFHPSATAQGRSGTLAGHPVVWEESVVDGLHRADTVLPYRHSAAHTELAIHAWVVAPRDADLGLFRASLATVSFSPRGNGPA